MATDWYYAREGQRQGPVPEGRLRELIAAGQVRPDDLVWRAGFPDWRPAREAPEVFSAAPPAMPPAITAYPPGPAPVATGALPMSWVPAYAIILGVIAGLHILSSLAQVTRSSHVGAGLGVVVFTWVTSGLAIAVAWGLTQRRRWAWQVNFWLYLVAPLVVGALVFAAVAVGFAFMEARWRPIGIGIAPIVMILVFGLGLFSLWPALNLVYFKKRRHLFTA